jgi:hypothetical protein
MAAAQMQSERPMRLQSQARDIPETRPLAMFGGRSTVEANNPELGPTQTELNDRVREMEENNRRNAK